ncbi:hypothetical protein AMK59_5711 [Oryctes borbonicus]|uniref:Receptor-binding cancer antigen n=1 Tax=Oryctes borbonicus TaxID=1629725 RepID=A0A0T6AZI4_9SCAR|nr:hypothetical protein AMK59_5711 [Oryctes borbonicus]
MFGMIIINKMRSFLLFFITLFRRALCCFRRRRRVSYVEPLTGIGIIASNQNEGEADNWNSWGNDSFGNRKPSTVQEHIQLYRQQKAQIQTQEDDPEQQADFFEDMTPRITTQRKLFISSNNERNAAASNDLSLVPEMILVGNELGEWDESSGWDGEKLECDAMEVLKEKKRIDRERKLLEQQQRRMERSTSIKVNA